MFQGISGYFYNILNLNTPFAPSSSTPVIISTAGLSPPGQDATVYFPIYHYTTFIQLGYLPMEVHQSITGLPPSIYQYPFIQLGYLPLDKTSVYHRLISQYICPYPLIQLGITEKDTHMSITSYKSSSICIQNIR